MLWVRFAEGLQRSRLALVLVASLIAALACGEQNVRPPNLILVVIDTARADHFGSYGYGRDTTPHFDAFAREAILFENAYATSCWTVPTHASLFTGLLPISHQATQTTQRLDGKFHTLAELVAARGYQTIAFSNNPWVSRRTNLVQGFEEVRQMWRRSPRTFGLGDPHPTNRAIDQWMASLDSKRPFFLFVNFMEPHWPYRAPKRLQDRFVPAGTSEEDRERAGFGMIDWYVNREGISDALLPVRESLYDAELAYADEALGELIALLKSRGQWEGSVIAVTSDHGENLGEMQHQGHSFTLYDSTIRIPMALRRPGLEGLKGRDYGARRTEPVQLTDLFTTFAAASGALDDLRRLSRDDPNVNRVTGSDLLARSTPQGRPVVAEYAYPAQFLPYFPEEALRSNARLGSFKREIRSLQIGGEKLIWSSDGRHELYDVGRSQGPREFADVSRQSPDRVAAMLQQLDQILDSLRPATKASQPPPLEIDESREQSLRALGYIR